MVGDRMTIQDELLIPYRTTEKQLHKEAAFRLTKNEFHFLVCRSFGISQN
jgi:hypothetical protein